MASENRTVPIPNQIMQMKTQIRRLMVTSQNKRSGKPNVPKRPSVVNVGVQTDESLLAGTFIFHDHLNLIEYSGPPVPSAQLSFSPGSTPYSQATTVPESVENHPDLLDLPKSQGSPNTFPSYPPTVNSPPFVSRQSISQEFLIREIQSSPLLDSFSSLDS